MIVIETVKCLSKWLSVLFLSQEILFNHNKYIINMITCAKKNCFETQKK